MVNSVIRRQLAGGRIIVFLLISIAFLKSVAATDCGTYGIIYPIEEVNPIVLIQQKLKSMEDSGELERRNLELQKRARVSVERPKAVKGITKAPKGRFFYYDPTYIVKEDLYDHEGRVFAKKGSKINPLETITLSQNLIFFDGEDEEQLGWVREKLSKSIENNSVRLVLVSGAPLELSETLNIPIYFDQGGILTKKLGIRHVPSVVSQEDKLLKIEEIRLEGGKQ